MLKFEYSIYSLTVNYDTKMSIFKINEDYQNIIDIVSLNVYSLSDNCHTLLGNVISLINNIQRDSFGYEISYTRARYITKNNVKILCMNIVSVYNGKRNLFISLTNDINSLIECLFYIAIKHGDTNLIEYLLDNYVNKENIENLNFICIECRVEPLKHVILNNNKPSLKRLTCKKINNVCTNIDKLPIPRVLRKYIRDINMIKEIIYDKKNKDYCYISYSYDHYLRIIRKFGLHNIVNSRLFVKGIKEYNCDIHNSCGHTDGLDLCKRKNYILYCEVFSYDAQAPVSDIKYISITFHQYKYMIDKGYHYSYDSFRDNSCIMAYMKCETLEQLPPYYDLIPKFPTYFSITAGSFDELNRIIENKVFIFVEMGIDYWYPNGYYKLNLELFVKP